MSGIPGSRVIVELVSEESGVSVTDLFGRSRTASIVHARQAAYVCLRRIRKMSLPECSKALGRGCHSSALNAMNKAEKREVAEIVNRVVARVSREFGASVAAGSVPVDGMLEWLDTYGDDPKARAVAQYIRDREGE
jgi:hypothetical protein